jgi:hypothetical protein
VTFDPRDERVHAASTYEEFTFAFWSSSGDMGGYTSLVIEPSGVSYAAAFVQVGRPLLHVSDANLPPLRSGDHLLVKGEGMWAEHICESPFEQWTVTNETYAAALDDPDDAWGRAYGTPTPIAFDLEWYATTPPEPVEGGYFQNGEVHGLIELGSGSIEAVFKATRTHRWTPFEWSTAPLDASGLRAPMLVGDERLNRVLTRGGWTPSLF